MDTSVIRSKRARSISSTSSLSSSGSNDSSVGESSFKSSSPPPPKYHKARSNSPSSSSNTYICVLPPTCSQHGTSTSYPTQAELDRHQGIFHKWICHIPIRIRDVDSNGKGSGNHASPDKGKEREMEVVMPESFSGGRIKDGKRWKECLKVFPDERLLNLHHTEVHDPIAREKKENGQKIFECLLDPSQCDRRFTDPKKRRRHMIDKHKYPPKYFFSITNHGINAIVQEDGLAISLIRPRRDPPVSAVQASQDQNDAQEVPSQQRSNNNHPNVSSSLAKEQQRITSDTNEIDMDDLTSKMGKMESSLTFIPRGVRKAKAKAQTMDIGPS